MVEGDLDRASQLMGLAFADYAWTNWVVDARDHVERITQLDRLFLQHFGLPYGNAWVTTVDGVVESVAAWIDTAVVQAAAPPPDDIEEQFAALEGDRHHALLAAELEYQGWRPSERHLYLGTMGTAPSRQRMGLGTRTLCGGLELADHEQLDCYLETSSHDNVNFYGRLGFDSIRHWRIAEGSGPDLWLMKRAAR